MVANEERARFRRSWPWWRLIVTGLSVLALILSVYLSWHYLVGGSVIGCGGGSPCDQVLSSRWSAIGGILPVSALAAGAYMAMLAASLFIGPAMETPVRRLAWGAMLVIVGAAAGSAIWFIILQKWFIGVFCSYCMTAHITGLLLAILVIWRAPMQYEDDSASDAMTHSAVNTTTGKVIAPSILDVSPTAPQCMIRPLYAIGLSVLGLFMAGIMAACQVVFAPPPAYLGGQSQDNPPVIDPYSVPLVGSPEAPYVVTLLFDYKCSHCQQIHFMLNEVTRRYKGKMAFALCPTPLNKQCNPYITGEAEEFKDSCELAKVALAVWFADREVFSVFENWMFSFESGDRWRPRKLAAAQARAVELVGEEKFDAALANPWIEQYLQTSIQIYGDTIKSGNSAIPKLVFGSRWVIPQPYDADDLFMLLQDSLGLPMPDLQGE